LYLCRTLYLLSVACALRLPTFFSLQPAMGPPSFPRSSGPVSAPQPPAQTDKLRSPPVFVAVMVACTVLTLTGLVLLAYLKMRHLW
jgi:hypothetical protein